ncbi:Protein bric-a-brac 2 [Biomphalaria pfeifferi]|uniref:Protein bric-a-brac 2 n=1 Tax=Biomphalaria pfeifferi TaxID=112525 RepID=A0AAD8B2M6_BIOPF|nr:Protein bric-a-brac 2 [Biomphalaria pfeifferi]
MKNFYIAAGAQAFSHLGAITVIKEVLAQINQCLNNPFSIFTRNLDFFGEILDVNDPILEVLLLCPQDKEVENMIKASLSSIAETINRQYKRYLCMNVSELMSTQTESARLHNMDSEEVIGMFSAAKKKAPNATMCYMSSRIRSLKNRTVAYLDSLSASDMTERVTWAIGVSRSRRQANRVRMSEVAKEIALRAEQKNQETERKKKN